ncbi:HEAT repeat domain-containing protein [Streptomyces sp. NPDC020362]|uniref:HEAT repeat domain-containing protein n=1 Tax=unclassified Streptomyces TaxID=2593676 RepID=UPI0033FCFEA5
MNHGEGTVFGGIDDVDWASMGHAYTQSATDVPELLWGLASDDPVRREIALDGMYGAVHHQGDVYDSTVACVPFLFELIANPSLADRGAVISLLCSIAHTADAVEDADEDDADTADTEHFTGFDDDDDEEEWLRHSFTARDMVRERAGAFLSLLGDPDPGVRAAVPGALARLHPDPAGVFGALRDRMPVETDPETAQSLAHALSTLAVRYPAELGTEAARVLKDLASGTPDPRLRMTALSRLARCAPGELPPDTADIALDVMRLAREADELGPPPAVPERPRTNTLISHVRELHAEHRRSLDLDDAADLLEELHTELRDRVDLRCPLLVGQLDSPSLRERTHAVGMAGRLLTGWRAPDDEPLLALARLLTDDDLRLQKAVLSELRFLAPAAHRVSEEVVAYLQSWEHRPLEADTPFRSLAVGMTFEVLALQGDDRIVPALAKILEAVEIPEQLVRWVEAFGPQAAAPLGPVLHDRLTRLDHRTSSADQGRIIDALGALRDPESVPLLTHVLAEAEHVRTKRDALHALSAFGTEAAEAGPVVRKLWEGDTVADDDRIHVAHALWALTGDAEAVLPAVRASLRSRMWSQWSAALDLVSSLGRSGAALAPRLREMIGTGHAPAQAAIRLWQVTAEAEETLPVLMTEWSAAPAHRPGIAACLAAMGPAAAPALPLIRAELASHRRHTNDDSTGHVRYNVAADVALQTDCRSVLAGFGEYMDTPVR